MPRTLEMSSIATSLAKSLPAPQYTGEEEELPSHTNSRGPRILGAALANDTKVIVQVGTFSSALRLSLWLTSRS